MLLLLRVRMVCFLLSLWYLYNNLMFVALWSPPRSLVIGGSEDGLLYIWDVDTSCVVQTLGPCSGAVYSAQWNPYQSLLASCGHDGIVRTWCYDDNPARFSAPRSHSPGWGGGVA